MPNNIPVHTCQKPFQCLNKVGSFVCTCSYKTYKTKNGQLKCLENAHHRSAFSNIFGESKTQIEMEDNCSVTDGNGNCLPKPPTNREYYTTALLYFTTTLYNIILMILIKIYHSKRIRIYNYLSI